MPALAVQADQVARVLWAIGFDGDLFCISIPQADGHDQPENAIVRRQGRPAGVERLIAVSDWRIDAGGNHQVIVLDGTGAMWFGEIASCTFPGENTWTRMPDVL